MTMADHDVDQGWADLIALDAEAREARMLERYQELAALTEEARRGRGQAMAHAEFSLPDDELRTFTASRLRVWLRLAPEVAQQTAGCCEAVMGQMPGPIAMRRVGIVQTVARDLPA